MIEAFLIFLERNLTSEQVENIYYPYYLLPVNLSTLLVVVAAVVVVVIVYYTDP